MAESAAGLQNRQMSGATGSWMAEQEVAWRNWQLVGATVSWMHKIIPEQKEVIG